MREALEGILALILFTCLLYGCEKEDSPRIERSEIAIAVNRKATVFIRTDRDSALLVPAQYHEIEMEGEVKYVEISSDWRVKGFLSLNGNCIDYNSDTLNYWIWRKQ